MLKKTIKFHDLDGKPLEETFYFHLSKAELAELTLGYEGGLETYLRKIIEAKSGREIIETFKKIIAMTVGQRSEDNRRFIKTPEITDAFMQSEAYTELFMELVAGDEAGVAFIKGVLPSNMSEDVDKAVSLPLPDELSESAVKKLEDYTEQELLDMPQDSFDALVGTDPRKMSKRNLELAFQRRWLVK